MKVFWSWQSDIPGKIGRYFVRDALAEAIKALKQAEEIEEPLERETREALHLDQDRQGVPGSPDLAPTIFKKIRQAAVFVADVTLVSQLEPPFTTTKKLINSNVAIEYGYALHAIGDECILMIQNRYYGEREELPFDLKHKAGPIQYLLPPDATRQQIAEEGAKLRGILTSALTLCLGNAQKIRSQDVEQIGEAARRYFAPELSRIIARQIYILERSVSNFVAASAGHPPPGDRWTSLRPAQPVLYPAAPEFSRLAAVDATLLNEFYSYVQEISDMIGALIESEPPPPEVNAWNVLMQKARHSLKLGIDAAQRFCPERQYDATVPVAGTIIERTEMAISRVQPALDAHLARYTASPPPSAAPRTRQVRTPASQRPALPSGPQSWMAK